MRTRVYSLRTVEGLPILDMALGLKVTNETHSEITISLQSGSVTLSKWEYLNKNKIYDNGQTFFILCTKAVSSDFAFDLLMHYAIEKIEKRIERLNLLKMEYQKELTAA